MSTGKPRDLCKERFWRRMIARQRKARMSVRRFCELHALSAQHFYAWQRVIQQRDAQDIHFIPVEVVPDDAPESVVDVAASTLELVLRDGRLLRIGAGFDTATLKRLLALLEEDRPC